METKLGDMAGVGHKPSLPSWTGQLLTPVKEKHRWALLEPERAMQIVNILPGHGLEPHAPYVTETIQQSPKQGVCGVVQKL